MAAAPPDASPAARLRAMLPCDAKRFGAPELSGAFDHCIRVDEHRRVCKRRRDQDATVHLTIEADGRAVAQWPTGHVLGDTGDFDVVQVNLGDERSQFVVASREGETVGIATRCWQLNVLGDLEEPSTRTTIRVAEYGTGSLVHGPGENACQVLETAWIKWTERTRGSGMYLAARALRYRDGRFEPGSTVARRYLGSFEKQRWATPLTAFHGWEGAPLKWLQTGELHAVDPGDLERGRCR